MAIMCGLDNCKLFSHSSETQFGHLKESQERKNYLSKNFFELSPTEPQKLDVQRWEGGSGKDGGKRGADR